MEISQSASDAEPENKLNHCHDKKPNANDYFHSSDFEVEQELADMLIKCLTASK